MTMPHVDDEQLSAHLDGEEGAAVRSHVESCSACESRLAELATVTSLVGAPVPPPPEAVRAAALAAARQAWEGGRGAAEDPGPPAVVTLGGRRRLPRWALPVAAAAVAVLVAVPVLSSLRDSENKADTTFASGSGGSANKAAPEVAATDGGDLGDQSDPASLGLAIRSALPGAATEAALAAPPPAQDAGEGADDAAAPTTAPGVAARTTETPTGGKGGPLANPPCAAVGRTTYGKGLGPLVYAARLRWQGQPAVALAYRLADAGAPGLDYRVLVMATEGCRLLVVQSL